MSRIIIKEVPGGGVGGEAQVRTQFRNIFPGVGDTIMIQQPIMSAWREEFKQIPGEGKKLFLKHLIFKKLDDYFTRIGRYDFPHITRPLGSNREDCPEGYWYQWVYGRESFSWEFPQGDGGSELVSLNEWAAFTFCFGEAGINLSVDVSDPDNGLISQNIVHEFYRSFEANLNFCWKRIDFGPGSMRIDYDKLCNFFEANTAGLSAVLGSDRLALMILAGKYLSGPLRGSCGELDRLTTIYRLSSLRQNTAEILSP